MEEKHNRMKVACGQAGSSLRSHANPSERQAEQRLQALTAPGDQAVKTADLSLSLGLACPSSKTGSLSVKTSGSSRPYLHRSADCRAGGSQFYRNTGSCQSCFYTSADRGSRGTRQCLEGNQRGRSSFTHGDLEIRGPLVSLIGIACPTQGREGPS